MRCPICDHSVDHPQGRAVVEVQSCPVCRAICRDSEEAEKVRHEEGTSAAFSANWPVIPVKSMPGVDDAFNWY